jgi:hypothetical protein
LGTEFCAGWLFELDMRIVWFRTLYALFYVVMVECLDANVLLPWKQGIYPMVDLV